MVAHTKQKQSRTIHFILYEKQKKKKDIQDGKFPTFKTVLAKMSG